MEAIFYCHLPAASCHLHAACCPLRPLQAKAAGQSSQLTLHITGGIRFDERNVTNDTRICVCLQHLLGRFPSEDADLYL